MLLRFLSAMFAFALLPSPCGSAPPIRVACVGSSSTAGAGREGADARSYPDRLQSLLGKGYLVGDFVSDGATLLEKGDRPYTHQQEFLNSLSFHPRIVFIELGSNDSRPDNRTHLGEFKHDYAALIDSFRALAPTPRMVLLIPPPIFPGDDTDTSGEVLSHTIVPLIRSVGYAEKCETVDLHTLFLDSPGCFPDRAHPSPLGAEMMASRLCEYLTMESDTGFSLPGRTRQEGTHSSYHGFDCLSFRFEGRDAKIALPWRTALGRPWIWRARFWGHEPQTEIALLERGFHVAYCDVAELFGNDEAIAIWRKFYAMLVDAGLATKSALEGFSRGGVYVYRWAALHPDRVACVYADAPVLDMKSWPGGRGRSRGNPEEWERFKKDFQLSTDAEAMGFKGNPIDLAPQIAGAGFPMLHVCGDADETVPVEENTEPFEKIIRTLGGDITVIHKPGVGHHPHSLANPRPIVDFILRAAMPGGRQTLTP